MDLDRNMSVLNTDRYDRRRFAELLEMSPALQNVEKDGSDVLPSFPYLLGDIWAGLFKNNPQVLEEVPDDLRLHRTIMEQLLEAPEFQDLRDMTRLDEFGAAVGAVHTGREVIEMLKKMKQKMKQKQKSPNNRQGQGQGTGQAQHRPDASAPSTGTPSKEQGQGQEDGANQAQQELAALAEALSEALKSKQGQKAIAQAVKTAAQRVKEDKEVTASLMSAGSEPGQAVQMPLEERLRLAELVRKHPKLKEIAEHAGRMRVVARKRQKAKTREAYIRAGITLSGQIQRALPSELLLLRSKAARLDTLRRILEGQIQTYDTRGKERLGKGPIVLCLDTSYSMKHLDAKAKGLALALAAIAYKQRRDLGVILFSSAHELKSWVFPKGRLTAGELAEVGTTFFGGGTDFITPLTAAVMMIEKQKLFKRADVVFITDGEASIPENWAREFLEKKRRLQFSVIAVKLGLGDSPALRRIADEMIMADDLYDQAVTNAVFAI